MRWIGPDGQLYLEEPTKTEWGSNETLIVSLPIAHNLPATLPGAWSVELWYKDDQLLSRNFRIIDSSG